MYSTKNTILLFAVILLLSCNSMSEEDILTHNQKVISGIKKKKEDLDKTLLLIKSKEKAVVKEYNDKNSFKLFRSSSKKQQQLRNLENKAKNLEAYRKRTEKLKTQLDLLHKTFDWQSSPRKVLEKVFEIAETQRYGDAIFLADPYDENDTDVDRISFIAAQPKEVKDEFIKNFKNGRIIGTPFENKSQARIEFLFGKNVDKKETMLFVKRKDSWYLSSF